MKTLTVLLAATFLLSCGVASDQFRSKNRGNLNRIGMGMSKEQVLSIMGREALKMWGENIENPYRSDGYMTADGPIEVLYFLAGVRDYVKGIDDDELVPVVLLNNRVVGWGWGMWEQTAQRYSIRVR